MAVERNVVEQRYEAVMAADGAGHNHLRMTLNSNAILPRCQRRDGGRIFTAGEGSA